MFVSPRGARAGRAATVILLPTPVAPPATAPEPALERFPDVEDVHRSIVRRLAAIDRLLDVAGDPEDEQIDAALRHVDAAILTLQRAAHEIGARRR